MVSLRKYSGAPLTRADRHVAGAVSYSPKEKAFDVELNQFTKDLNVNTTSAYVAIQESLKSFASSALPSSASKTFIYTYDIRLPHFTWVSQLTVGVVATP